MAAQAACVRARRNQRLPLVVLLRLRLPADSSLPGQMPVQDARCPARGRKLVHVNANFHSDILDRRNVNHPGRIQLLLQLLVNKRDHQFLDPRCELGDLLIEMIQMAEQLLEHETMMGGRNLPCKASSNCGIFERMRRRAQTAPTWPRLPRLPQARSRISRPETPKMSLATTPSLMLASSRSLWMRLAARVRSPSSWARCRVKSRNSRCTRDGTKLLRSNPCCRQLRDPLGVLDVRSCGRDGVDVHALPTNLQRTVNGRLKARGRRLRQFRFSATIRDGSGNHCFAAEPLEQRCGEVALAETGGHGDDHLAAILRLGRQAGGGGNVGARADAAQNAFLAGQAPRPGERLFVGHRLHAAEQAGVEILGNEAGADALDLVRAGLAAGDDRRIGRLDGIWPESGDSSPGGIASRR